MLDRLELADLAPELLAGGGVVRCHGLQGVDGTGHLCGVDSGAQGAGDDRVPSPCRQHRLGVRAVQGLGVCKPGQDRRQDSGCPGTPADLKRQGKQARQVQPGTALRLWAQQIEEAGSDQFRPGIDAKAVQQPPPGIQEEIFAHGPHLRPRPRAMMPRRISRVPPRREKVGLMPAR